MCVKLATGMTTVKLATEFGEFNHQCVSEMYRMMISMIDSKAEGILHGPNTMVRWVASFPDFASRIERKLAQEEYGGLLFDNFCIFGFVDCKIVETCHLGYGPAEDQPGAPRHEDADLIQECVYTGYVKRHGLKVLTVVLPNGLIGGLYGPVSARENDISMQNLSNLNQELMLLQPDVMEARENGEDMLYYSLYGDLIFPLLNCIVSRHRRPLLGVRTPREEAENAAMRSLRVSVEWPYETVTNLFKILESKYNKQLLGRKREPLYFDRKTASCCCFFIYIIFMFAYMEANSLGSLMLCH